MSNFNFELALNLVKSTEQFPVDFDDAWQWLEYSRKDVAKKAFEKCGFLENVDYVVLRLSVESDNEAILSPQEKAVLQRTQVIKLTNECFKVWAMMAGTVKGKEVRLYYLECEKIAQHKEKAEDKLLEKTLKMLEQTNQRLETNEKIIQQSLQSVSILEEEKFEREYYLNQIHEITKEYPLFSSLFQFALTLKNEQYMFPLIGYTVKQILEMFTVTSVSSKRFSNLCSDLYFLNKNKKPNEIGTYKYTGDELIYPSLILFKLEDYSWDEIKEKFEINFKLKYPTSNRRAFNEVMKRKERQLKNNEEIKGLLD